MLLISAVLPSVIVTGCASITGTTGQSVSVMTKNTAGNEVTSANCELTNNKGTWYVTSPGSVSIHRSNDDLQVLCKKQGEENGRVAVVSATKGSMFGNIVFGGGIGAVIDHNNGSAYEYPTLIQVIMGSYSKIEPPKTQAPNDTNLMNGAAPSANTSTSQQQSKLRDLREMHDKGLVSESVYAEKQKEILEGK